MIKPAIICIRIASIIYFLIAVLLVVFGFFLKEDLLIFILYSVFILPMVFWCEITILGLKKTKYWAWVSSIIMFAIFIPSLFIIMGIIGIKTMLSEPVRNQFFGIKEQQSNMSNSIFINTDYKHVKKEEQSIEEYIESNAALKRYLDSSKEGKK
uniref:hypothetical protein n=1 Tax=Acetivibrio cellulolyticus TaxID=35830 RepID=UPI0001E2F655|nr:hypothetical protein [Acetivibrio cellulolyticus]